MVTFRGDWWLVCGLLGFLLGFLRVFGGYELPTIRQGDARMVAYFERTQVGVVKETPITRCVRFRVSDELHIESLTGYGDLRHLIPFCLVER